MQDVRSSVFVSLIMKRWMFGRELVKEGFYCGGLDFERAYRLIMFERKGESCCPEDSVGWHFVRTYGRYGEKNQKQIEVKE